jgi:hypothetical protein
MLCVSPAYVQGLLWAGDGVFSCDGVPTDQDAKLHEHKAVLGIHVVSGCTRRERRPARHTTQVAPGAAQGQGGASGARSC